MFDGSSETVNELDGRRHLNILLLVQNRGIFLKRTLSAGLKWQFCTNVVSITKISILASVSPGESHYTFFDSECSPRQARFPTEKGVIRESWITCRYLKMWWRTNLYESSIFVNMPFRTKVVWSHELIRIRMNHRELGQNVRTSGDTIPWNWCFENEVWSTMIATFDFRILVCISFSVVWRIKLIGSTLPKR